MPCSAPSPFPLLTAAEAATLIKHDQTIGCSGFTAAGSPKAIPQAIAAHAVREHTAGRPYRIGVLTGASTGQSLDGALAEANAIKFRAPYQSNPTLRRAINAGTTKFVDLHLSQLPQAVRNHVLGPVHWAIIEAAEVTSDGEILLTSAVGASPTFCQQADKILIELNCFSSPALRGLHDIYEPADPPYRREIPIYRASDRIGTPTIKVDPRKIVGVVETNSPDESASFSPATSVTTRIGEHVADFLASEIHAGRIPPGFLPLQSGVGNVANAVLAALGRHPEIPRFSIYSEVLQDAVIELMDQDKIDFASASSLTLSTARLKQIYDALPHYRSRLVLRPQEISNNPEVVRRLGVIAINTALEVDILGNVNSTHVFGQNLMNGIGGSGDFTRNGHLSIFVTPSLAKGGNISTVVPLVSHLDHSEHSVQIIVSEHGVADLRGKEPRERAELLINTVADPSYREELMGYLRLSRTGHSPQSLAAAFQMQLKFGVDGTMHGVNWEPAFV